MNAPLGFLYDGRRVRHPDGTCLRCGAELPPKREPSPKLYCGRTHQTAARRARSRGSYCPKESGCGWCGKEIAPPCHHVRQFCSLKCRQKYRLGPFGSFVKRVKKPHTLDWLGPKLGKDATDPLLPRYAIALAERSKLVVYLSKTDGRVRFVGVPKS